MNQKLLSLMAIFAFFCFSGSVLSLSGEQDKSGLSALTETEKEQDQNRKELKKKAELERKKKEAEEKLKAKLKGLFPKK